MSLTWSFISSGTDSPGSWRWMTMEQKQADHLERWGNSTSTDHYTLVGGAHKSYFLNVLHMYCRSNNNVLYSLPSHVCVSVFSPSWRRHERDRSSHEQTIHRRLGGLRVPLHALHWLPLSAGGGRRWRQEHQHLHQLEDGFSTASFLFFTRGERLDRLICHPETD